MMNEELYYKLASTQTDKETLFSLLDEKELLEDLSPRVVENYKFFLE
jgi:hypothetical protein